MTTQLGASTLYLNLTGEMMYIIDQRLSAQNVGALKSSQVLCDMASALLSPSFETELFPSKCKALPAMATIRAVMIRLVHASIMKLNQHSIDKLLDLIIMGVKRQIFVARHPIEILQCTLNHLDSIGRLVNMNSKLNRQIAIVKDQYTALFRQHSYHSLMRVKSLILNLFEDHRVKISVLLSHGLQFSNATIIPRYDGVLPPGTQQPGLVRYFKESDCACSCLARSVAGLNSKPNRQPHLIGMCSASPSTTCSTATSGSRQSGESIHSVSVLKVSVNNQASRVILLNHSVQAGITLPNSGVSLGPPLQSHLLSMDRACKLGCNIYPLPIPNQKSTSETAEEEEEDVEMEESEEEDDPEDLVQEIVDTQQNLPMPNITEENPFYLHNMFENDQEEERYKAKDNQRAQRIKKSIQDRATLLLGSMDTPDAQEEEEIDLLALMDS